MLITTRVPVTMWVGTMVRTPFDSMAGLNEPEAVWRLPLTEAEPLIVLLDDERPEGRDLPPPWVGDHEDDDHQDRDAGFSGGA